MQVPVLEHNGNIIAESLDLLSYLDANFEGPKLFPRDQDPAKQAFADELIASSDSVIIALFRAGRAQAQGQGDDDISELLAPALDKVESSLGRFSDGPFLLGKSMSAVSKLINHLLVHCFLISFADNNRIASIYAGRHGLCALCGTLQGFLRCSEALRHDTSKA